ncbi:hypothetical protein M9H77_14642 [Catharanthus roseus]|uniref:Uncharacterized protein n=1 Tax=Catharanthus roseus TaxID=4058 RepID=A0ACC0BNW2_CATRO|nr:hypothetical protein M9H77_14642 [Catharanthus roseus]
MANSLKLNHLCVRSDSQVVIGQVTGIFEAREAIRAVNGAGLTRTCTGLYPFLAEKYYMGTGIPIPYPGPWRVGSGSKILYPGGYGSGSGSKFNYKGTDLGLGVP